MLKLDKIGPVAVYISIVLGVIGIVTIHVVVGIPLCIIGMLFGYLSCGYVDAKMSYIGVTLNNIGLVWLAIICIIGSSYI